MGERAFKIKFEKKTLHDRLIALLILKIGINSREHSSIVILEKFDFEF